MVPAASSMIQTHARTVRQHYVPAGYLAGFTLGGKRDSLFFVHSLDGLTVRQDKPENVAFERNYSSIDVDGLPNDYLEGIFGRFEGPACALFKELSTKPRPFATMRISPSRSIFWLYKRRVCHYPKENMRV